MKRKWKRKAKKQTKQNKKDTVIDKENNCMY